MLVATTVDEAVAVAVAACSSVTEIVEVVLNVTVVLTSSGITVLVTVRVDVVVEETIDGARVTVFGFVTGMKTITVFTMSTYSVPVRCCISR